MLVYYFVHIRGNVEAIANALLASAADLSTAARLAYRSGEELRLKIAPGRWLPAKEVEVSLGRPTWRAGTVTVPLSWRATGPEALFPMLDADLVVEAVGEEMVQITLRGSYKPPLGPIGLLIDRALLHRIAEACVKNFLDRVGAGLLREPDAPLAHLEG